MPFLDIDDKRAYQNWSDAKRRSYDAREQVGFGEAINVLDADALDDETRSRIASQIKAYNFCLYNMLGSADETVASIKALGEQCGLQELDKNLCAQEDRLTQLTVKQDGRARHYIPYSNKAIGWHTDGYYNPMHQRVLAVILHCETPAAEGGVNELLDHDMVYIHLRDEDPRFIQALSEPEVMCIPENVEDGELIRPRTYSAVFLPETDEVGHLSLNMRYSRRKRNIEWAEDTLTQEALACLEEFLDSKSQWHVSIRLKAGEGVLCNNILHTRSAFSDDESHKRVYYRARYYNRIQFK